MKGLEFDELTFLVSPGLTDSRVVSCRVELDGAGREAYVGALPEVLEKIRALCPQADTECSNTPKNSVGGGRSRRCVAER